MKKIIGFLLFVIYSCNLCCAISPLKKASTKKHIENCKKCSIVIPDTVVNTVPSEMQYIVYMQLIFNLIKTEYVKDMSDCEVIERAISGLLASLDPHSSYLNEKAFTSLKTQTEGEFGGLGIEIVIDEGFIRVISPIDDTPAYKAGIKNGDVIVCINDEYVNGITAEEAVEKLRGKPKTKIKLKIKREGKALFDLEIVRDVIKVQSVKAEVLNNIGYIRISTFDKNVTKDIKTFIKGKGGKLHGIILDLRNNPGGLLEEAISASNIFLDGGKIVFTKGRIDDNTKSFSADSGDLTNGLPLVVLINSGTASAPEILAGALRDNDRAIIVGTRSFGKGSVQKMIPLSEKTAVRLTVAKHYTPSGECIQANGIIPDIEADCAAIQKPDYSFVVREESINNVLDAENKSKRDKVTDNKSKKAIDNIGKKKKDSKDSFEEDQELLYRKMPLKERTEKDYQLNKAFDTIVAMNKFKKISGKKHEKK